MRVLRVRSASFLLFVLCTQVHAQGQGELLVLPDVRVCTTGSATVAQRARRFLSHA
jgi:hypothetical protein